MECLLCARSRRREDSGAKSELCTKCRSHTGNKANRNGGQHLANTLRDSLDDLSDLSTVQRRLIKPLLPSVAVKLARPIGRDPILDSIFGIIAENTRHGTAKSCAKVNDTLNALSKPCEQICAYIANGV